MKIVFIGTVALSEICLSHLIGLGADIAGVVTRPSSQFHSDYAPIAPLCERHGIDCLETTNVNTADAEEWIRVRSPDIIFCFGWSQLLGNSILAIPVMGVVGYHPALLPRHRGRHPLIWALVLGLAETGSTFFFMDRGADSGDILSQRKISISMSDDAGVLYRRVSESALEQITEFLPQLQSGHYPRVPQQESAASSWRKRSAADGRIDWRMPATGIYNLIRALTKPYPGATMRYGDVDIAIWRSRLHEDQIAADIEPGQVVAVSGREITVKAGQGAIVLVDHDLAALPSAGDYL